MKQVQRTTATRSVLGLKGDPDIRPIIRSTDCSLICCLTERLIVHFQKKSP